MLTPLMKAFNFTANDLEWNRGGRISPEQEEYYHSQRYEDRLDLVYILFLMIISASSTAALVPYFSASAVNLACVCMAGPMIYFVIYWVLNGLIEFWVKAQSGEAGLKYYQNTWGRLWAVPPIIIFIGVGLIIGRDNLRIILLIQGFGLVVFAIGLVLVLLFPRYARDLNEGEVKIATGVISLHTFRVNGVPSHTLKIEGLTFQILDPQMPALRTLRKQIYNVYYFPFAKVIVGIEPKPMPEKIEFVDVD